MAPTRWLRGGILCGSLLLLCGAVSALSFSQEKESFVPVLTEVYAKVLARARSIDVDCKNMKKCFVDEDPLEKITGEAISVEDQKKLASDTENRARNIMTMLDELSPKGLAPEEKKLQERLQANEKLLKWATEVRDKSLDVLMRRGIEVKLPSEDSTYVDASGRHWGEAGSKTDLDYLQNRFHKYQKKLMDEQDRRDNRQDVKQFHNPLALKAKEVMKLGQLEDRGQRQCPCECPSTSCPCMCTAKIRFGDIMQGQVEADTFPENPDTACFTKQGC